MFCRRKKETVEAWLPFRLVPSENDRFDIEACGPVCCDPVYLFSAFMLTDSTLYENGTFTRISQMLSDPGERRVKVIFTLKNEKPADGKLDLASLAEAYQDDAFLHLELLGWGLFPYSIYEKTIAENAAKKENLHGIT